MQQPNTLNANPKTLELVATSPFAYWNCSVLIHPQNVDKQYH